MAGSIQIKHGYYYTVIDTKDSTGKRKQKWQTTRLSVRGNNKRRAEQILRERITAEERRGAEAEHILFSDFMLNWLEVIKTQVKENTFHQYELLVKNSIAPYFAQRNIPLQELQPQHIQDYYLTMLSAGKSANTVKHHHANIRKALKMACKQNQILHNPADEVELPKVRAYTGNFFTVEQIKQILTLVKDMNIEIPVTLAAVYGFRRSEVVGLKWSAIDFVQKTITVRYTVTGSGRHLVYADETKTTSSKRTLPLYPEIEPLLQGAYACQQQWKSELGSEYHDDDYVCVWPNGRLLSPEYISRRFKRLLRTNGLPVYRFHDLRHSVASLLASEGKSLKQIGEFLGHASVATTNRYAHLTKESVIDTVNTIGDKLLK